MLAFTRIFDYVELLLEMFFGKYPLPHRLGLWGAGLIFGVAILALCICSVMFAKRARALGIVAGIANFVACLCIPGRVIRNSAANQDTFFVDTTRLSIIEIGKQVLELILKNIPSFIFELLASGVTLFAFVITLIFFIRMFKLKPKALVIVAFVLFVLRFVFLPLVPSNFSLATGIVGLGFTALAWMSRGLVPYDVYIGIIQPVLEELQGVLHATADLVRVAFVLPLVLFPFFLLFIASIVTMAKRVKAKKRECAALAEADCAEEIANDASVEEVVSEEIVAEEASAEEAPAEEIPVSEEA